MTDNEIIKALECCSEAIFKEDCEKLKCLFFDNEIYNCMNVGDESAMHRYSLDLIARQKAEIERLKLENHVLSQNRIAMPERLEIVNNARDKAIREFANRLKCGVSITSGRITCEDIDNLVKGMTEEYNDQQKT